MLAATLVRRDLSEDDREKWSTMCSSPVVREVNRWVEVRGWERRLMADSSTLLVNPGSRVGWVCGYANTSRVVRDQASITWASL